MGYNRELRKGGHAKARLSAAGERPRSGVTGFGTDVGYGPRYSAGVTPPAEVILHIPDLATAKKTLERLRRLEDAVFPTAPPEA